MIQQNAPCNPAVHALCMELAKRFTAIVQPLLRQEEVGECMREAYMAARRGLGQAKAGQVGGGLN